MRKFTYALIGVVGAFSLFIFTLVQQFPAKVKNVAFGPAFFPLFLLAAISILLLLLLENRRAGSPEPMDFSDMRLPGLMMGLVGVAAGIFEYAGFVLSSFVFLLPAMFLLKARPKTVFIVSSLVIASIYVLFKVILRVPLPVGSLWEG